MSKISNFCNYVNKRGVTCGRRCYGEKCCCHNMNNKKKDYVQCEHVGCEKMTMSKYHKCTVHSKFDITRAFQLKHPETYPYTK